MDKTHAFGSICVTDLTCCEVENLASEFNLHMETKVTCEDENVTVNSDATAT